MSPSHPEPSRQQPSTDELLLSNPAPLGHLLVFKPLTRDAASAAVFTTLEEYPGCRILISPLEGGPLVEMQVELPKERYSNDEALDLVRETTEYMKELVEGDVRPFFEEDADFSAYQDYVARHSRP